jgi:hypothetical protein
MISKIKTNTDKRIVPVCPLTPLAAPVAVKRTIASRSNWILCNKVDFCSAVNWGLVGSKDNLNHDRPHRPVCHLGSIVVLTF